MLARLTQALARVDWFRSPPKRDTPSMNKEAKLLVTMREACDGALRELSDVPHEGEVVALRRDIEDYRQEVSEQIDARERFASRNAKPA